MTPLRVIQVGLGPHGRGWAARVIPDVKEVAALSAEGRVLVFPLEEVKELPGGGKGVMAIKLHEGEAMLGVRPVQDIPPAPVRCA